MKRLQYSSFIPSARIVLATVLCAGPGVTQAALLNLSNTPLFLTSSNKANALMLFGNSNSMDGDATGAAAGSANATSKSEIARNAIKSMIANYTGLINMGLLGYQQSPMSSYALHNSQYDATYNPANYDATSSGPRNGVKKRFRSPNPTSSGEFIYYNTNLPFYSPTSQGNAFCYSSTACTDPTHDFTGTSGSSCTIAENPVSGPWDAYSCYSTKTGTSDAVPGASGAGYSNNFYNGQFSPTDSDLGQGITDFGKRIAWQYVSPAWFANTSPGMGYLHVPVAALDATQAAKLNTKLGTSQFATNAPVNASYPLQNAGLSPLEGTVLTANNYFNGTLSDAAQGATAVALPNSCGKNFLIMLTDGLPSVDKSGNPSANTTVNLSNLTTQVRNVKSSAANVESYIIGFALPYGVNPSQLDAIASAGGTDRSYYANDTATLQSAFSAIFSDIVSKTGAASAVALNSQSITTGSRVYQAKFNSTDWSGQLLSLQINPDGSIGSAVWDAGQAINLQSPGSRTILTYKPSTKKGITFRWPATVTSPTATEMDTAQTAVLNTSMSGTVDGNGSARLDYLRGSAVNEGTAGLKFRARPTSKLGDIINSAPNFVGVPAFNYNETDYAVFRQSKQTRQPMIYVGANDGMLHGFNAVNGQELLAYIPSRFYNANPSTNLSLLTSPSYAHRNFVDGSPNSADVYYGGAWHTALVSGMGVGGRGVFGLDVTDPAAFSEANAASLVNFEFSDADDPDVGYISGQPSIVKLNDGTWAAVFGNGYNSTGNGNATLFIVNIKTGALIKKISTGVGSTGTPNALANPIAIDIDGNGTADTVYAGDLQGNMWKFDISGSARSAWALAYKVYAAGQPITTTPEVGKHPNGGYLVYFGTGKYIESTDIASTTPNAVYGIWDNGAAVTGSLLQQTVSGTTLLSGQNYRSVSQNPINWSTSKGWFINLPTSGERFVTDPTLHNGRIIFTSMIPSTASCSYGGSSWLMELNYLDGSMLRSPPFDTNGNGTINASDTLVGGRAIATIGSAPAIQPGLGTKQNPMEAKYINESSGTVTKVAESADPRVSRRVSWRQIK